MMSGLSVDRNKREKEKIKKKEMKNKWGNMDDLIATDRESEKRRW
jgi:hypothetical protein